MATMGVKRLNGRGIKNLQFSTIKPLYLKKVQYIAALSTEAAVLSAM